MKVAQKRFPLQSSKKSSRKQRSSKSPYPNIPPPHNQCQNNLNNNELQNKKNIRSNLQIKSRNNNRDIYHTIPFSFHSSVTNFTNNNTESIAIYKYKWEVSQYENQMLKEKIKCITVENMELRDQNKQLQVNMEELLKELSQYKNFNTGTLTTSIDILPTVPPIQQKRNNSKPISPQLSSQLFSNQTTESINYKRKYELVKKLTENLSKENNLLIQFKTVCLNNISVLKQKVQKNVAQLEVQKQISLRLQRKMQEQLKTHIEDQKSIEQLQKKLKRAQQQINDVTAHVRLKEQQWSISHDRFHRDLSKMKERCQKYKNKGIVYRNQRDELALEIQRAKIEIGAVTLRRFLPDDNSEC